MKIQQTRSFQKNLKKLHQNQEKELDEAVHEIIKDPLSGEEKKGDLSGVRIFKFKMNKSLILLAYTWKASEKLMTLLKLSGNV